MAEVQWYYARNDQQFGPVSASELKQLALDGRLSPDDLLWREGMDAWTTAINLRSLFSSDSTTLPRDAAAAGARAAPTRLEQQAPALRRLRGTLRLVQWTLWSVCIFVVLAGVLLFTRAFLIAKDAAEETAAGAVYSTFFVAAYVLARCGEKLSRLLLGLARRRER